MLAPCQHRGPLNEHGRYPCACPKLTVHPSGVLPATCARCPYSDNPPSVGLVRKAANLGTAIAQHVRHGLAVVDNETHAARLAVCKTCDQFTERGSCKICGCNMNAKAKWAEQDCPLKKWSK
jgi:hypothetical protein